MVVFGQAQVITMGAKVTNIEYHNRILLGRDLPDGGFLCHAASISLRGGRVTEILPRGYLLQQVSAVSISGF